MRSRLLLVALASWAIATPALASTMPAIDRTGHALALGSGGTSGAGLALDLAVAPRWRVGIEAGNHNFTHLYAYAGLRGSYLLSEPGEQLQTAITAGVWGEATGPVIRPDNTTYTDYRVDRYALGMSWAYAFTPELVGRLTLANLSDFLWFNAMPWNLLAGFYGQDTGVELGYRLSPHLELTLGCNTRFNQLFGVSCLF